MYILILHSFYLTHSIIINTYSSSILFIFQGNIESTGKQIVYEPSPVKAVVKKVIASFICAYIYMKCVTVYPVKQLKGML